MTTTSTPSSVRPLRRTAIVAAATALALVAAACSGGSDDSSAAATTTPSTAPATAPATTAPATTGQAGLKPIDQTALQAMADATVKELLVPGVVVLLRTPQGEFTAAYGTTALGAQTPPGADTHFRIASMTKTMTAAVILLLAQEGKLKLDDPVSKYVPEVPNGDNITLAELLEMRSGLYSFTDAPEIAASHGRRPDQGVDPAGTARHRVRAAADVRARRRVLLQQHQLRAARPDHRAAGRQAAGGVVRGPAVQAARDDEHDRFPLLHRSAIPEPFSHGYLYGSSSHVHVGHPALHPGDGSGGKAGTLQPNDYTDINHSFFYAAGAVISTAADLATWMNALAGGKVFNAEYQRIWQDSAKIINPKNSYNWYGYGIDQLRVGIQHDRPPRRPDPRVQLGGGVRPRQRHDVRDLDQPHHVPRQQVHGRGHELKVLDQIYACRLPSKTAPACA